MGTQSLGSIWKGRAWDDGNPVPRTTLPDGSLAEAMAAIGYAWNATAGAFQKLAIDNATGGLTVYVAGQAGGGSAVSIADGADVAQGTTSDVAWVSGSGTVISLLKKIASAGGSAVSIADGANVAQGTTTDLASANTLVGLLKNIKAALAGTLTTTTSWASAQHVIVDTAPSTAVTGPLTDTQLRATAVPVSGTVTATTGGLTDTQLRASAVPVSATQLPAALAASGGMKVEGVAGGVAQPVSLATNTPDVTDRAARLVGHVTVDNASLAVTMATQTPDVTDRAARLLGVVDKGKVWDGTNIAAVKAASVFAVAADPALVVQQSPQRGDASILAVTATAAVNTALTLTLPSATGLFHYITSIQIVKLYSVVGVAAGAGNLITTTNIPGSVVWTTEQLASAAGTAVTVVNLVPTTPLKSTTAATNTTIVCPQQLQTIWRINVTYYTAP